MEAVPPTSSIVSVKAPALTPNLEAELPSSKDPDPEALVKPSWLMLEMLFELAFRAPPNMKALIWRVPVDEIIFVPPPLKVRPPPEVVTRMLLKSASTARRPLVMSNEPAKDEEPVPEKVLVPYVKKLPDTDATPPNEAVPLVSRSPEMRRSLDEEMELGGPVV